MFLEKAHHKGASAPGFWGAGLIQQPTGSGSSVSNYSAFNLDEGGTKYVIMNGYALYKWNLSPAYNTGGVSGAGTFFSASPSNSLRDWAYSDSGTLAVGVYNSNTMRFYGISPAFSLPAQVQLGTKSYSSYVSSEITGVCMFNDGFGMVLTDRRNDRAVEFSLSTAYDITGETLIRTKSFKAGTSINYLQGGSFTPDGFGWITAGNDNSAGNNQKTLREYKLTEAYNIGSATGEYYIIYQTSNLIQNCKVINGALYALEYVAAGPRIDILKFA